MKRSHSPIEILKARLAGATRIETDEMKRKRRHLTAEFKARVAMEALRGIRTINEIAQENELAPTQVTQWKKELESRVAEIFSSKNEVKQELALKERKEQRLERKVGQLVIECHSRVDPRAQRPV